MSVVNIRAPGSPSSHEPRKGVEANTVSPAALFVTAKLSQWADDDFLSARGTNWSTLAQSHPLSGVHNPVQMAP